MDDDSPITFPVHLRAIHLRDVRGAKRAISATEMFLRPLNTVLRPLRTRLTTVWGGQPHNILPLRRVLVRPRIRGLLALPYISHYCEGSLRKWYSRRTSNW